MASHMCIHGLLHAGKHEYFACFTQCFARTLINPIHTLLQSGFALLEAGTIRSKNVRNILLKNVIDACVAAIAWWAVGDAFAYGNTSCDNANPFIGTSNFFSSDSSSYGSTYFAQWLFAYGFSATASTIVSGAVAERTQFRSYLIYTCLVSAFIYPVVVHWVWSPYGWLSAHKRNCSTGESDPLFSGTTGFMDFAGSAVVHMVGGAAALVGSIVVGPRIGRFSHGVVVHFDNSNSTQMVLGTLILWLGWYGFNAGSTGCMFGCMGNAALAAANTTISIAAGGLMCLLAAILVGSPGDISTLLNGILAGAVSITASCALVEPYAAFVIGLISALVYLGSSKLLLALQIDDPLDASPVHLFCGCWGVIAAGFFAVEGKVKSVYGYAGGWGVLYGGGGTQLGIQVLGAVVIAAWSASLAGAMFLVLKVFKCLRVSKTVELEGLDKEQQVGSGQLLGCLKGRLGKAKSDIGSDEEMSL